MTVWDRRRGPPRHRRGLAARCALILRVERCQSVSERVAEKEAYLPVVGVPELEVRAGEDLDVRADVEVLAERPVRAPAHVEAEGRVVLRADAGEVGLRHDVAQPSADIWMEVALAERLAHACVELADGGLEVPERVA